MFSTVLAIPPRLARALTLACLAWLLLGACGTVAQSVTTVSPAAREQAPRPYVVMVSFDAFRWDYPEKWNLPAFAALAHDGARAERMIPTFPSKTFPNHYAIASGMYAGHHGLVGNDMYDPARRARYMISDTAAVHDARWYGGEPIWVTAERQGVKAASYFWPVSDAAVGGVRPSYWHPYDRKVADSTRVDGILAWLALPPAERPHLVLGYFSDVDDTSHQHGPEAPQTRAAAQLVDRMLARLRVGIARLPIADSVTVIVVSDHGMAATDSVEYLADYASLDDTTAVVAASTYASLFYDGDREKADRAWSALRRLPHAHVWRRAEIPERLHLRDNPRAGDVYVLMDPPYVIERAPRSHPEGWRPVAGNHGYDNQLDEMHAVFFAAGPEIIPGSRLGRIENVSVYPFIAHLLGLTPAPGIDGALEATLPILRRPDR
jgi:predicted AlkP superfamily pyrophosphatase or phosphodiesterase